jgi:hypothetical protein
MTIGTPPIARPLPWMLPVVMLTGLLATTLLLAVATYDFAIQFRWLALPPAAMFVAILWTGISNTLNAARARELVVQPVWKQVVLAGAIPCGFLASSLGCMGIELAGCTTMCNLLTRGAIPLTFIIAIVYVLAPRAWLLMLLACASLVFLIPNCRCDNVINHRWIHLLGLSPACFSLGVTIAMTSIAAISTGRRFWISAGLGWSAVSACFAFFIAHHYFDYPW